MAWQSVSILVGCAACAIGAVGAGVWAFVILAGIVLILLGAAE